jgi:hypothetical protein
METILAPLCNFMVIFPYTLATAKTRFAYDRKMTGRLSQRYEKGKKPRQKGASVETLEKNYISAGVGSIIRLSSETRLAGKPPWRACSRTISSFGAIYTQ